MIEIDKNKQPEYQNILTNEALDFLEKICNKFEDTRQQILENRKRIQDSISSGNRLSFPENKEIREIKSNQETPIGKTVIILLGITSP